MIKEKLKQNEGITLITLMLAVVIMLIISSVLIYNTNIATKTKDLNNMYADITNLKNKVDIYYSKHSKIPVLEEEYINTDSIKTINANDNDKYYVIDLEALENLTLYYGKEYENYKQQPTSEKTDIYVINEKSHNIYYVKGIQMNQNIYYTMPGDYTKVEVPTVTKKVQVGQKYYASMELAINAIQDDTEATIILLEDIQETITIPASKIIKLELNNKTINGTITNNGTLIITGEGNIIYNGNIITNNGDLTIQSGNITTNVFAGCAIWQSNGSLKILGGTISNLDEIVNTDNGARGNAIYIEQGKAELLGGTLSSKAGNAVRVQRRGSRSYNRWRNYNIGKY